MSNTEKKLDALIDALGFDVERLTTNRNAVEEYKKRTTDIINFGLVGDVPIGNRPKPEYDYKLTKRDKTKEKPKGIKCYRVFDHENEQLFRTTYIKPDLDCKRIRSS